MLEKVALSVGKDYTSMKALPSRVGQSGWRVRWKLDDLIGSWGFWEIDLVGEFIPARITGCSPVGSLQDRSTHDLHIMEQNAVKTCNYYKAKDNMY